MPRLNHHFRKCRKHEVSGQAVGTLKGEDICLRSHGTQPSRGG